MKTVLPWILVLGLGAALGAVYFSGTKKDAELAKLRETSQEAEQLRTELAEAKDQAKLQQNEVEGLRKDQTELLRLRNEVGKLRDQNAELSRQAQTAQTQAERAQAQAAQAVQTGAQQLQQLQSENQQLRSVTAQTVQVAQQNACINNLRQLDGAKQQWALENGKTADAVPTAQDLAPYLKDNKMPVCPAGGTYTLNAVNQPPACSIPGHVLPK